MLTFQQGDYNMTAKTIDRLEAVKLDELEQIELKGECHRMILWIAVSWFN
jgi:hypothetical protein